MFLNQSSAVMETYKIREFQPKDQESIFKIWAMNQDLATGFAFIADTDADIEQEFYKNYFSKPAPIFHVVEDIASQEILGWSSVLPFIHNPIVTRFIGEASIYLDQLYFDGDIGSALMQHTFKFAEQTEVRHIYGWIRKENSAMISLAEEFCGKDLAEIPASLDGKLDGYFLYFYNVPQI